jgi:hypothetical protein
MCPIQWVFQECPEMHSPKALHWVTSPGAETSWRRKETVLPLKARLICNRGDRELSLDAADESANWVRDCLESVVRVDVIGLARL